MAIHQMKAVCPNNPLHKRFYASAKVREEWIVNEYGDFIEVGGEKEVMDFPEMYEEWQCVDCLRVAKFE